MSENFDLKVAEMSDSQHIYMSIRVHGNVLHSMLSVNRSTPMMLSYPSHPQAGGGGGGGDHITTSTCIVEFYVVSKCSCHVLYRYIYSSELS